MRSLMAALGHPERSFRSVHVAGTNGKGSVVAMVHAALRAAGHCAARYTSPHLIELSERFVIDGRAVDRPALEAAAAGLRDAVDRLMAGGQLQAPPTFFEATTALAFDLFRRHHVEVAVCEVGLGGRLDATNVLEPMATAITTIGLDHQQYLGDSLASIAREKAGIIKQGVPVIVGPLPADARQVVEATASELGAPVIRADDQNALARYQPLRLALPGAHQLANATIAVKLLEEVDSLGLPVPASAIKAGLEQVVWPGRLETRTLADGREALLDAAHNPDGARALRDFLLTDSPRPIVFAAMRDKDATTMIELLAAAASAFVITRTSNLRSTDPSALAEAARRLSPALPVIVEPAVDLALAAAWQLSKRIVVAGSIFLLGDAMNVLNRS